MDYQTLLKQAYEAFNARDIDAVLALMHPDVDWPNGWEGGYVHGYEEVRDYWTRQWQQINPRVTPVSFQPGPDGQIDVGVHQLIRDLDGQVIADGLINHVYTIEAGKIRKMVIESV
ncbi:nuclear transport factor 2 family protein [Spirosoma sp. KNUC1025]|uniref:nuclear transport factor 2 family protein n=1 Tax=Spirosoma sp. KNUC1025 TaxID=2894082 RepID=UPI0038688621|nr:nuclear transport factor 2 family protein [Spirosoma sp. KNUC1025]